MNARDKIMACHLYRTGDPFYLTELSNKTGMAPRTVKRVINELIEEGKVAPVPKGTRIQVSSYHRVSQATLLIRKRWDRSLDISRVSA